jgi:hypothetical protein
MFLDKTGFDLGLRVRGRRFMKQLFKDKRGSAIITVLIVMGVLTLLGAAVLQYSVNDNLQVHNDERRMQAHYLARSGAEAVANYIINHPDEADELLGKAAKPVEPDEETLQAKLKGTFDVVVTKSGDGYLITSTGHVDDFERTVKLTMEPHNYQGSGLGEYAIFCNEGINLKKGTVIKGNIGTNANDKGKINANGEVKIEGNVMVGPGGDPDSVISNNIKIENGEAGILDSKIVYKAPSFPEFPTVYDQKDSIILANKESTEITFVGDNALYYKSIELYDGSSLTINVGGVDREIVVDELVVGGDIKIVGDGCLKLYVNNNLDINGNINFKEDDEGRVDALMIYYKGNDTVGIEKEIGFCGTLFINGNLDIKKDCVISGNIIVLGDSCSFDCNKNMVINGVIYAPNSSVVFKKDTTVNGTVIADTLSVDKDFTMEFNYYDGEIEFPYETTLGFRKGIWSD